MDPEELEDLFRSALPARQISSLQQAFRVPKRAVPILIGLLKDEAPCDHGDLRRYFESKMVLIVQVLRPVELGADRIPMLCHAECTEEALEKIRTFELSLSVEADELTSIIGLSLDLERVGGSSTSA